MARKNGLKNDTSAPLTFNARTKAVMADVVQDINVKEKVGAVREVVSGHSTNEIIMVLQFYDYNVEKTIQAYVEDGAKEALQEWQFSGSKPVKKKRNKKKGGNSGAANTSVGANIPASPGSVSSEASSSATGGMVNGDARRPLMNGDAHQSLTGANVNHNAMSNGPTRLTYPTAGSNFSFSADQTLYPTSSQSVPTETMTTTNGLNDATSLFTKSDANSSISAQPPVSSVSQSSPPAIDLSAPVLPSNLLPSDVDMTLPGATESPVNVTDSSGAPQPQRQAHHHPNRQRNHSGSHGHHDKHGRHGHKLVEGEHGRDRTTSTSSTDGKSGSKKHAHMGLERSSKDLYRQTVSLERLRLVFDEEMERSCKRIKTVFEEIRNCLAAREKLLCSELTSVQDSGRETFHMRQGIASTLKRKIDGAEKMSEEQLADLRTEIKHFVSDRKIDDDIARTTRFLYDDDKLKEHIQQFGEVVTLKCSYEVSADLTAAVSAPAAETPRVPEPVVASPTPRQSHGSQHDKPSVPHLDAGQTHEMAELQRRLKQSLNLGGIHVETYPGDQSTAAPLVSIVEASTSQPESPRRNDRNRQRGNRNRGNKDRPRDNPQQDNSGARSTYNQTPSGERVILIGKKTGAQSGGGVGSRPQRGQGSSRGRGRYQGDRSERGGSGAPSRDNTSATNTNTLNQSSGAPSPAASNNSGARAASNRYTEKSTNRQQSRGERSPVKGQSDRSPVKGQGERSPGKGQGQGQRGTSPRKSPAGDSAPLEQRERSGSSRRGGRGNRGGAGNQGNRGAPAASGNPGNHIAGNQGSQAKQPASSGAGQNREG